MGNGFSRLTHIFTACCFQSSSVQLERHTTTGWHFQIDLRVGRRTLRRNCVHGWARKLGIKYVSVFHYRRIFKPRAIHSTGILPCARAHIQTAREKNTDRQTERQIERETDGERECVCLTVSVCVGIVEVQWNSGKKLDGLIVLSNSQDRTACLQPLIARSLHYLITLLLISRKMSHFITSHFYI